MTLAVDFSQWGGPLNPETVECWKSLGVKKAIVQYSHLMEQHIEVLESVGGISIDAYVYLYWNLSPWNQTPQQRTQATLDVADNRIETLWLDCEDSTYPYNERQLKECEGICNSNGMPAGIYTGRWWWVPHTNNSKSFSHLPLWHAGYQVQGSIGNPNFIPDLSTFIPYGDWNKPTIWQYQGTCTLCNHSVDLNFDYEFQSQPPKLQSEDGTYSVIFGPDSTTAFLWNGRLTPIGSELIFYDIIKTLNIQPVRVSKETFQWMENQI